MTIGLALSGAHLAVLQVMAWAGMLVAYSSEGGLDRGMSETFGGKRPCALCRAIEETKASTGPERDGLPPVWSGLDKIPKDLLTGVSEHRIPPAPGEIPGLDGEDLPDTIGQGRAAPAVPPPEMG